MHPAIGLTKILNYLEESNEIIEEIKKNNDIIISLKEPLESISDYQKELVKILENDSIEQNKKALELAIASNNNFKSIENILKSYVEILADTRKEFLKSLHGLNENSSGRMKNLIKNSRLTWFKSWDINELRYDLFKGIVTAFSNWEYPAMEIFPGTGNMLKNALAAEPLYIVDPDDVILDHCSQQFNEYYANKRLMKYKIEDYDLSVLPQKSFGFIYSINQTLIENLDTITILSKNVYDCLLPGGIYLLAYNNSNYWWAINNIIDHGYGVVDKNELETELKKIGFEIVDHKHIQDNNLSYIIVKKPGEIEYIKNSSILANIIDKPEDLK